MAAQVITAVPSITRFQIVAANLAQEFQFTGKAFARVTVQLEGSAGKLALVGTDGIILAATDYIAIAADAPFTLLLGRDQSTSSVFVQSDSATTFVSVVVEPRGGR